jgi:hypothetical protein
LATRLSIESGSVSFVARLFRGEGVLPVTRVLPVMQILPVTQKFPASEEAGYSKSGSTSNDIDSAECAHKFVSTVYCKSRRIL